ncbi:DNA topoisomerase 3 [Termitomyces sp. T112]|nr:DNA topoisomerase 3 [Termitomyces sp. T112]
MRVLCVAEKPSISKSISQILSGGQFNTTATRSPYIKNYEFNYPQTNSFFIVTCVSGHLTGSDFSDAYRKWNSCDPFELFDAPVQTFIPSDKKAIEDNLLTQARRADMLMIWTDCDREGEHIGMEIVNVCRKAKRDIVIKRARFSAIIAQQIHRAAQHPIELDRAQADSVEARIMLDLKVGSAFTRMQTLILQNNFGRLSEGKNVISYGPCQFPTLGFVVQKYNLVKSFVSEPFWYIYLSLTRHEEQTVFTWKRGHIFDQHVAISLYDFVLSTLPHTPGRITKVTKKETKKWKPLPLTTVELQKAGSRLLRLAPKKVLDIAESLYQQGFLSYPRTETDQFDPQFDFMSLIQKQAIDPTWGAFANLLSEGGDFSAPRRGKNNDKAHPPIHPTAHAGNLAGDDKRVYEFITRRFLASCSKDAKGWQTTVDVECGGEYFSATGLVVMEKNYLEVYPYEKWEGHSLPNFEENEEFQPSVCELREGKTTKPNLLTEADLVTLMDKNGIGTDATIAQHIETIINRDYVIEKFEGSTKYLIPSKLGIGLVEGYNQINLGISLSKPQLRRETERDMIGVCEGRMTKADMLEKTIDQYKEMFIITKREFEKVVSSVRRYLEGGANIEQGEQVNRGGRGGGGGDNDNDNDDGGGGDGGGSRSIRGRGAGRGRGNSAPRSRGRGEKGVVLVPDIDINASSLPSRTSQAGRSSSRQNGQSVFNRAATEPTRSRQMANATSTLSRPPLRQNARQRASAGNVIYCDCGFPATQRVHTSESTSKGKKYWECGNNKGCDFYERDVTIDDAQAIPTKRSYSRQDFNSGAARICRCNEPAIRLSANTSANQGRLFWRCVNAQKEGDCNYFVWDDELEQSSARTSSSTMTSQGTNECFKCHQTGHWASGCPHDGGNNKRQRSFGPSANTRAPNVTCYKCNEEGHISTACPNGNVARSNSARGGSADGRGGRSSQDTCFKCGKSGHWSSECPGSGGGSSSSTSNFPGNAKRGRGRPRGSTKTKRCRGAKKKSAFGAPDD